MSHATQSAFPVGGRAIVSVDTANRLRRLVEEVGIPRAKRKLRVGRTAIASGLARLPMTPASAQILEIRVRELDAAGSPEAA